MQTHQNQISDPIPTDPSSSQGQHVSLPINQNNFVNNNSSSQDSFYQRMMEQLKNESQNYADILKRQQEFANQILAMNNNQKQIIDLQINQLIIEGKEVRKRFEDIFINIQAQNKEQIERFESSIDKILKENKEQSQRFEDYLTQIFKEQSKRFEDQITQICNENKEQRKLTEKQIENNVNGIKEQINRFEGYINKMCNESEQQRKLAEKQMDDNKKQRELFTEQSKGFQDSITKILKENKEQSNGFQDSINKILNDNKQQRKQEMSIFMISLSTILGFLVYKSYKTV